MLSEQTHLAAIDIRIGEKNGIQISHHPNANQQPEQRPQVELDDAAGVCAGDRLYVGIALTRRQAILTAGEMLEAEVVRVDRTTDDRVAVAARFVNEAVAESIPIRRAVEITPIRRAA